MLSLPQIDRMTIEEIKDMVRSATGITEFQRRVYLALLDVPKGSLRYITLFSPYPPTVQNSRSTKCQVLWDCAQKEVHPLLLA